MADKDNQDKKDEELSEMEKVLSIPRAVGRLLIGAILFLLWFFLGVPPAMIYTSGIQTFIGTISFFNRNPIIFLLIALFNIFVGLVSYIFSEILWWSAFHILWSLRWFYGYNKYRGLKNVSE